MANLVWKSLRSPAVATSLVVVVAVIYMYFVYRDLQAHHRYIYDLNQRVDALQQVVHNTGACIQPVPIVTDAATSTNDAVQEPMQDDDVVSVASDELRSMLNIIADQPPVAPEETIDISTATMAELRAFLKARDINARGSRDALAARVFEVLHGHPPSISDMDASVAPGPEIENVATESQA